MGLFSRPITFFLALSDRSNDRVEQQFTNAIEATQIEAEIEILRIATGTTIKLTCRARQ
jgi:hypothetical protein